MKSALVSASELNKILYQPQVKVIDASYGLPPSTLGIPGAQDFDIDDIADPQALFAHTIPTPDIFAKKVSALGISNDDLVVVYDRDGIAMAAARAWWMFRLFGHNQVMILDGGLPAWTKAGYALKEKTFSVPKRSAFRTVFHPELVKFIDDVKENITAKRFMLIDARDSGRFRGEKPDPRPHVQTGHIPGALNIPFMDLLNADKTLKSKDHFEKILNSAGISLQEKLACSCGSGVTACVIALALYELGRSDVAVYDGSWTEWGSNPSLPKTTGA